MYVNVVFDIRRLYSAVSLTLVREQRFIRIIYDYYYMLKGTSFWGCAFGGVYVPCIVNLTPGELPKIHPKKGASFLEYNFGGMYVPCI